MWGRLSIIPVSIPGEDDIVFSSLQTLKFLLPALQKECLLLSKPPSFSHFDLFALNTMQCSRFRMNDTSQYRVQYYMCIRDLGSSNTGDSWPRQAIYILISQRQKRLSYLHAIHNLAQRIATSKDGG